MIDIDITMPIQIANILLLIVIMNIVLYRPVRRILEERQTKIASLNKDIETFNKNAQLRLEDFDRKLGEARIKAKGEFEALRGQGQSTAGDEVAKVRKEVEASKAEQLKVINTQFATAQQELKGQVETFAKEMASKVLGREV